MLESNHAYQQQHYSPEAYVDTRVAQPEHFREAVRSITDEIESSGETSILVLGCNCGKNDLLPLVEALQERENGTYHIIAIDDQPDAVEQAAEDLRAQGVEMDKVRPHGENKPDAIWNSDDEDLNITLLLEDIEVYPPEVFGKTYDIVLSFFVFNHLTNWQLCVNNLCNILREEGKIFVTKYDDPITRGLENNPKKGGVRDSLINIFYEYHENRKSDFDITYCNSILGTRIEFLREYLRGAFNHEVCCEVGYEVCTSEEDIKKRLDSNQALHTPIFWGSSKEDTSKAIPDTGHIESEEKCYEGDISVHKFTIKKDNLSTNNSVWDKNFRNITREIDEEIEVYPDEDKNEPKKWYNLLLQRIAGYQSLVRNTQFLTPLFWRIKSQEEIDIDLESSPRTWKTLINSRNDEEIYKKYSNHLLSFRRHDTKGGQDERRSIAEVIFSRADTSINWIFEKTSTEFTCEVINSNGSNYFVIKIPENYIRHIAHDDYEITSRNKYGEFNFQNFNNFVGFDFSHVLEGATDKEYGEVEELMEFTFNDTVIESQESLRREEFREALRNPVWNHLDDEAKDDLVATLARRSPRFAYLVQLGTCVYITDKLYDKEGGGALGSGGFFFCEKGVDVDDLKDPTSFLYHRYELLQDVANTFSRRTVLPSVTSEVTKAKELRRLMSLTKHNLTHHLGYAERLEDSETRSLVIDDIRRITQLLEHTESKERIKKFLQGQYENISSDKLKCSLSEKVLREVIDKVKEICKNKNNIEALDSRPSVVRYVLDKGIESIISTDFKSGDEIETIPWMSRLIFKDIIINALKSADVSNPKVHVREEILNSHIRVIVENNKPINEKYRKQINSDEPYIEEPDNLGIYLYRQFGDALGWSFNCPEPVEGITEIIVRIPTEIKI